MEIFGFKEKGLRSGGGLLCVCGQRRRDNKIGENKEREKYFFHVTVTLTLTLIAGSGI
jgi:hypothetical protein